MFKYLAGLIGLVLLAPAIYLVGFGLINGLDVPNGLLTVARGFTGQELIVDGEIDVPEALLPAKTRDVIWRGELGSEALGEASGLVASRQYEDTYYSLNDSGNEPALFVLGDRGEHIASWSINYSDTHDLEDLAAFSFKGRHYLLMADTGDNLNWRPVLTLIVIAEPDPNTTASNAVLEPEWTIRYQYPEGYRDSEAVAVDELSGKIIMLSKRRVPAEAFSVPLARGDEQVVVALREGRLLELPQPTERDRREDPRYGANRSTPTALDIHGRRAVVITYRDAYLYVRGRSESWEEAFKRLPERIALPDIHGLEAGAFSADGLRLLLVGERKDGVGRMGLYELML